jgi:hypothetical protein
MKKHKKTARELADIITMKLRVAGVHFDVHKDAVSWHAVVFGSSPEQVARAQAEIDRVVQDLRSCYDLSD